MTHFNPLAHHQRGVVILGVLLLLILAAIGLLTTSQLATNAELERNKVSTAALATAREALIAYAVSETTRPGRFPCPEDSAPGAQEGTAKANCSSSSIEIGRLPWRSLKIGKLLDGHGEPLWYALSPGFRDPPINSDSVGTIKVDGAENAAVALIISAGPPLPGQNRGVSPPLAADYLDEVNAVGSEFISRGISADFNDRILVLDRDSLLKPLERRVTAEVRNALNEYFASNPDHYYPYPADFGDSTCLCTPTSASNSSCKPDTSVCYGVASTCAGPVCRGRIPVTTSTGWGASLLRGGPGVTEWFHQNGWRELVYYAVTTSCSEGTINCNGTSSYLQLDKQTDKRMIVIGTGRTLNHQSRSLTSQKTSLSNYLEELNFSGTDRFITRSEAGSPDFNDQPVASP